VVTRRAGADVVVVGGGLVGAALAYELSAAGAAVVLVDRRDAGRATDAGAGILSPQTWGDPDESWCRFADEAGAHYRELVPELEELGSGPCGYAVTGLLTVSIIPGDEAWFGDVRDRILSRSAHEVAVISPDHARTLFPPIGSVRSAVHSPGSARVDGRLMGAALTEGARRRGATVVHGEATVLGGPEGRVTTVSVDGEPVGCDAVVVAGGAWTPETAGRFGVDLPIAPLKGQIVHLQLPGTDSAAWPIVQPVMSYYLVPWPDGRVACGGTMEGSAGFDTRPTAAGLHELLRECLVIAPGLAPASWLEVRVGLRPASADGRPVLGRLPGWDNAYVATGHGAEGLLLGPYSAALVARSMGAGRPGIDAADATEALAPFAPDRFAAAAGR
jgi:D-amino-acid dehydrogenase